MRNKNMILSAKFSKFSNSGKKNGILFIQWLNITQFNCSQWTFFLKVRSVNVKNLSI